MFQDSCTRWQLQHTEMLLVITSTSTSTIGALWIGYICACVLAMTWACNTPRVWHSVLELLWWVYVFIVDVTFHYYLRYSLHCER